MLAVLVVAEWSHLTWAERYKNYNPNLPFWYSEWIDLHTAADFESVCILPARSTGCYLGRFE